MKPKFVLKNYSSKSLLSLSLQSLPSSYDLLSPSLNSLSSSGRPLSPQEKSLKVQQLQNKLLSQQSARSLRRKNSLVKEKNSPEIINYLDHHENVTHEDRNGAFKNDNAKIQQTIKTRASDRARKVRSVEDDGNFASNNINLHYEKIFNDDPFTKGIRLVKTRSLRVRKLSPAAELILQNNKNEEKFRSMEELCGIGLSSNEQKKKSFLTYTETQVDSSDKIGDTMNPRPEKTIKSFSDGVAETEVDKTIAKRKLRRGEKKRLSIAKTDSFVLPNQEISNKTQRPKSELLVQESQANLQNRDDSGSDVCKSSYVAITTDSMNTNIEKSNDRRTLKTGENLKLKRSVSFTNFKPIEVKHFKAIPVRMRKISLVDERLMQGIIDDDSQFSPYGRKVVHCTTEEPLQTTLTVSDEIDMTIQDETVMMMLLE